MAPRVHGGGAYQLRRTCARSPASQMRARPSRRRRRAPPCVQRRLGLPGAHSFTVYQRVAACTVPACTMCSVTRLGGSTLADRGAAALVLDAWRAHRLMCVAVSDSSLRCLSAVPRTRWGGQRRALPRLTAVRFVRHAQVLPITAYSPSRDALRAHLPRCHCAPSRMCVSRAASTMCRPTRQHAVRRWAPFLRTLCRRVAVSTHAPSPGAAGDPYMRTHCAAPLFMRTHCVASGSTR